MTSLDAFQTSAAQASRGDLALPINVEASLRRQQALLDPDCHLDAAARLLRADPLLAVRAIDFATADAALNSILAESAAAASSLLDGLML